MNDKWTFDGKGLGMPWDAFGFLPWGCNLSTELQGRLSVQTGSDLEVSW